MFLIDLPQVMEIVRTFHVDALVDDKVLTVFLACQGIAAMGAPQGIVFGKAVVIRGEVSITDLAFDLSFDPVVAVEVGLWGIATGTGAILRNIAFLTPGNRLDFLVIPVFKVGDEELPVPSILVELNFWEIIRFKLLVFWRMGIIKGPLPKRDISTDKTDQPAILLVKVLNDRNQIGNNIHKAVIFLSVFVGWFPIVWTQKRRSLLFLLKKW